MSRTSWFDKPMRDGVGIHEWFFSSSTFTPLRRNSIFFTSPPNSLIFNDPACQLKLESIPSAMLVPFRRRTGLSNPWASFALGSIISLTISSMLRVCPQLVNCGPKDTPAAPILWQIVQRHHLHKSVMIGIRPG